MVYCREYLFQQICRFHTQGRGIDTGMTAKVFSLQNILVDQQLNPVFPVIHQTQYAKGAGRDIQKFLHEFSVCKAES
jgi:hypothetical protein